MNVNIAIKNIKSELKNVKAENKIYKNKQVVNFIIYTTDGITEIEKMLDEMLDLESYHPGYNYMDSIKNDVNWCYKWLADCYFMFYIDCGTINGQQKYDAEENRLKACQI